MPKYRVLLTRISTRLKNFDTINTKSTRVFKTTRELISLQKDQAHHEQETFVTQNSSRTLSISFVELPKCWHKPDSHPCSTGLKVPSLSREPPRSSPVYALIHRPHDPIRYPKRIKFKTFHRHSPGRRSPSRSGQQHLGLLTQETIKQMRRL